LAGVLFSPPSVFVRLFVSGKPRMLWVDFREIWGTGRLWTREELKVEVSYLLLMLTVGSAK